MKKKYINNIDFFIITHNTPLDGPINYYENFLIRNKKRVFLISHPLDDYANRSTSLFDNKKEIKNIRRFNFGLFNLFLDYIISFNYILKYRFNVFVGANNFDTLVGIIARKLGKKINKIIYFATDFSENRFKNNILNKIYYYIERKALDGADVIISNTERAEKKRLGICLDKSKSIIIQNGVYLKDIKFEEKKIKKDSFIFIGSVTKEHGLYDLLNEIFPIINRLVVIGAGDDWDRVLKLCKERAINTKVYYKKDHAFCIDYLKKFRGIGLAPYNLKSKWTYYCSPLKVAEYIACGLPVLMSSLPEIASHVKVNNLGVVYGEINRSIICRELESFCVDNFNLKAEKFYNSYNQNKLYSKIII